MRGQRHSVWFAVSQIALAGVMVVAIGTAATAQAPQSAPAGPAKAAEKAPDKKEPAAAVPKGTVSAAVPADAKVVKKTPDAKPPVAGSLVAGPAKAAGGPAPAVPKGTVSAKAPVPSATIPTFPGAATVAGKVPVGQKSALGGAVGGSAVGSGAASASAAQPKIGPVATIPSVIGPAPVAKRIDPIVAPVKRAAPVKVAVPAFPSTQGGAGAATTVAAVDKPGTQGGVRSASSVKTTPAKPTRTAGATLPAPSALGASSKQVATKCGTGSRFSVKLQACEKISKRRGR